MPLESILNCIHQLIILSIACNIGTFVYNDSIPATKNSILSLFQSKIKVLSFEIKSTELSTKIGIRHNKG